MSPATYYLLYVVIMLWLAGLWMGLSMLADHFESTTTAEDNHHD